MKYEFIDKQVELNDCSNFSLPNGVTSSKGVDSKGNFYYEFNHNKLGELGKLHLIPRSKGTQFLCAVVGEQGDPVTNKRQEILTSILIPVVKQLETVYGENAGYEPEQYFARTDTHLIESKMFPCEKCNKPTSLLVFAPDADNEGKLEDYNRRMFSKIKDFDVPTWIIGYGKDVIINGQPENECLIAKVWPKREKARIITSAELNPIIDGLMENHCLNAVAKV